MPVPVVLLDRGEAAKRLHVSERTVRRWGKAGLVDERRIPPRLIRYTETSGGGARQRRKGCCMMLPLTRHRSGRAAPLDESTREAPPAPPAPEPETEKPAGVVVSVDDSDDPDVATVLTDDATAEEIAARLGHYRAGRSTETLRVGGATTG